MSRKAKAAASADQPDDQPKRRGATVPDASALAIAAASLAMSGFIPAQIAEQLGASVVAELEAVHQSAQEAAAGLLDATLAAQAAEPPATEPTQEG